MEQVGAAVTIDTYIREMLSSNLGRNTAHPDWDFPQFSSALQINFEEYLHQTVSISLHIH
jgi:hypothetical protein